MWLFVGRALFVHAGYPHQGLQSPRLTKLEIRDGQFLRCADFEALLGACQHLKHLSLYAISCEDLACRGDVEGLTWLPNRQELQLRSIALTFCDPHSVLVRLLQHSIHVGILQRLSVLADGSGELAKRTKVKEILQLLNGSALEHIVFNVCLGAKCIVWFLFKA
ncbi:hypothetical protein EDD18DRAFT_496718 [Armillaria luteobubalina]|uniref:F-box domain-containing protein n=1 Tax=Armillaria luteobubalina TaxID=153913 RepID=A0AA39UUX8_9AGAR|nr:hypothetical protein EDD18DRAFT_496718 [Armillaria luteobubalina]